jgi:hypothetical protein
MSVFKKVWPDAFSGRMEYILNTTMMSLLEYPDSTVLSINRMLTDKDFRKRVVASVTDSAVKNAWDELMKWDDKRWSEAVAALINKVGQFSTNPVIRNILGQPKSTFDFRKAMDERKIIIINLSKGMIGEQNAPLLGAMLITKIYLAAMSRAELPAHVIEKTAPFYFYVDEFQNFANESFASILSEARKYKLCLTIANQFIAQMEETIRDAVFGNMGTTIAFRVGTLDAEFMEKVFAPVFTQEDLQNIAFAQMYLTLQIDNMGSKPFSAKALDPIPPLQTSMRVQVIERSRTNFGRPRVEVEESIREFFGYGKKDDVKVISSQTVSNPAPRTPIAPRTPTVAQAMPPRTPTVAPIPPRGALPSRPPAPSYKPPVVVTQPRPAPLAKPVETNPAPVVQNKISPPPQPIISRPVTKTSDSLNDLLNKLDDSVTLSPIQAKESAKTISQPVTIRNDVKPFNKELTRAASPEKKNALQEALAKAMAGKTETPKSAPVVIDTLHIEKPTPAVQINSSEFIKESQEEVPIQQKKEALESSLYNQSKTVREVPEDILRKALE